MANYTDIFEEHLLSRLGKFHSTIENKKIDFIDEGEAEGILLNVRWDANIDEREWGIKGIEPVFKMGNLHYILNGQRIEADLRTWTVECVIDHPSETLSVFPRAAGVHLHTKHLTLIF